MQRKARRPSQLLHLEGTFNANYDNAFTQKNEKCLLPREMFLKCYFKQAEPWETCHHLHTDIYKCKFFKNPSALNVN